MSETTAPPGTQRRAWIIFVVLSAGVAAADLWTKRAAFELLEVVSIEAPRLSDGKELPFVASQQRRDVIPGFFQLEANYNHGAFHGWFGDHTSFLAVLSALAFVVIVAVIGTVYRRESPPSLWFAAALGLVSGGTLGNLHDRALVGGVRDFIKWYVVLDGRERVWPNFNVADSGICVGVGILILIEIRRTLRERRARRKAASVA